MDPTRPKSWYVIINLLPYAIDTRDQQYAGTDPESGDFLILDPTGAHLRDWVKK